MVKNWFSQPDHDWIDGINWFFFFVHGDTNLWKLKVTSVIFGWLWWKMSVDFYSSLVWKIYCTTRMNLWTELIFLDTDSDAVVFD